MIESLTSNARYAVGDSDGLEGGAIFERRTSNARYAVADSNRGEGVAIFESIISNARYAVGDSDGLEGGATMESIISNARHAVGDNCVLTTCYQCIGCCLDNGIAVITTIVFCIATFYTPDYLTQKKIKNYGEV